MMRRLSDQLSVWLAVHLGRLAGSPAGGLSRNNIHLTADIFYDSRLKQHFGSATFRIYPTLLRHPTHHTQPLLCHISEKKKKMSGKKKKKKMMESPALPSLASPLLHSPLTSARKMAVLLLALLLLLLSSCALPPRRAV